MDEDFATDDDARAAVLSGLMAWGHSLNEKHVEALVALHVEMLGRRAQERRALARVALERSSAWAQAQPVYGADLRACVTLRSWPGARGVIAASLDPRRVFEFTNALRGLVRGTRPRSDPGVGIALWTWVAGGNAR